MKYLAVRLKTQASPADTYQVLIDACNYAAFATLAQDDPGSEVVKAAGLLLSAMVGLGIVRASLSADASTTVPTAPRATGPVPLLPRAARIPGLPQQAKAHCPHTLVTVCKNDIATMQEPGPISQPPPVTPHR